MLPRIKDDTENTPSNGAGAGPGNPLNNDPTAVPAREINDLPETCAGPHFNDEEFKKRIEKYKITGDYDRTALDNAIYKFETEFKVASTLLKLSTNTAALVSKGPAKSFIRFLTNNFPIVLKRDSNQNCYFEPLIEEMKDTFEETLNQLDGPEPFCRNLSIKNTLIQIYSSNTPSGTPRQLLSPKPAATPKGSNRSRSATTSRRNSLAGTPESKTSDNDSTFLAGTISKKLPFVIITTDKVVKKTYNRQVRACETNHGFLSLGNDVFAAGELGIEDSGTSIKISWIINSSGGYNIQNSEVINSETLKVIKEKDATPTLEQVYLERLCFQRNVSDMLGPGIPITFCPANNETEIHRLYLKSIDSTCASELPKLPSLVSVPEGKTLSNRERSLRTPPPAAHLPRNGSAKKLHRRGNESPLNPGDSPQPPGSPTTLRIVPTTFLDSPPGSPLTISTGREFLSNAAAAAANTEPEELKKRIRRKREGLKNQTVSYSPITPMSGTPDKISPLTGHSQPGSLTNSPVPRVNRLFSKESFRRRLFENKVAANEQQRKEAKEIHHPVRDIQSPDPSKTAEILRSKSYDENIINRSKNLRSLKRSFSAPANLTLKKTSNTPPFRIILSGSPDLPEETTPVTPGPGTNVSPNDRLLNRNLFLQALAVQNAAGAGNGAGAEAAKTTETPAP